MTTVKELLLALSGSGLTSQSSPGLLGTFEPLSRNRTTGQPFNPSSTTTG